TPGRLTPRRPGPAGRTERALPRAGRARCVGMKDGAPALPAPRLPAAGRAHPVAAVRPRAQGREVRTEGTRCGRDRPRTRRARPGRTTGPSGDAVGPGLGEELRAHELLGPGQLLRRVVRAHGVVAPLEVGDEGVDDVLAGHTGLPAHRVDALVGALGALVRHLLPPDAQHLEHLLGVDVVAHRHVVEHHPAGEALLRRTADLALLRGDVVERDV